MLGVNLPNWFTIPTNHLNSVRDFGVSISRTAVVLLGSGNIQCHCVKTRVMLLLVLAKDEDVVHVAKNTFPCENRIHSSLKVLRGAQNDEGQFVEAITPEWVDEGCEGPGLLI